MEGFKDRFVLRLPKTLSFQGQMAFSRIDERKTQKLIVNTVTESLERQLWVVTKAYGDNYYDIQKGSSYVLSFDFNTGKLSPTGSYSDGNQLRHLRCWNAAATKLVEGTLVRIAYRAHNVSQKPYIKAVVNMPFGQKTAAENSLPFLEAGLWAQSLSSGGLNPLALNCFRPDPTASTLTVWSGIGGHFNNFPVLLDKDARPVLCFAERKSDNSNWEKLRVVIATGISTELEFTCNWTGADTSFGQFLAGFNATNADGSLVYFSEGSSRRAWRKRGELLEEITLASLNGGHFMDLANMSDAGLLIFPDYENIYSGLITYAAGLLETFAWPTPTVTWTQTGTKNKIDSYSLDLEASSVPLTQIAPEDSFSYAHPAICPFNGRHGFDGAGRMITWQSARDSFNPANGGFEEGASVGFDSNNYQPRTPEAPDFRFFNQARNWGRKIAGAVSCYNGTAKEWTHLIEFTAGEPLTNAQLTDPFLAAFATQVEDNFYLDAIASQEAANPANEVRPEPLRSYNPPTFGGYANANALISCQFSYPSGKSQSSTLHPATGGQYQTGEGLEATGHFLTSDMYSLPVYNHFHNVFVELLPRGRNITPSTAIEWETEKRNNWDVFAGWSSPTTQTDGTSRVVADRAKNANYVAITVPVPCFFGGGSTMQGNVDDLLNTVPVAYSDVVFNNDPGWREIYVYRAEEDGGNYYTTVNYNEFPLFIEAGGAAFYGLGYDSVTTQIPIADVVYYYVRDIRYLSRRYVRKINSEGALVWEKDLTQLVAGAEFWKTKLELGIRIVEGLSSDLVGAKTTEALPLGDDMGSPHPVGRVVLMWADFHELGANFQPTQRLLILDDSNGDLLHTLPLIDVEDGLDPDEVLAEDILGESTPETSSDYGTGDGITAEFPLSAHAESIIDATVDGLSADATLSGDGNSVIFAEPPGDGLEWYVEYITGYIPGDLIWRAGEKRFDATVTGTHVGVDPADKEWALIGVHIEDRLPLPGEENRTGNKTMRLKMGASISVAPVCDWIFEDVDFRQAIHGGSLYRLSSNGGGANSILRKTNPSTS